VDLPPLRGLFYDENIVDDQSDESLDFGGEGREALNTLNEPEISMKQYVKWMTQHNNCSFR